MEMGRIEKINWIRRGRVLDDVDGNHDFDDISHIKNIKSGNGAS